MWIALFTRDRAGHVWMILLTATTLAAGCTVIGFVSIPGTDASFAVCWLAFGFFAALAIPTLLSLGVLLLLAAILILIAMARMPHTQGHEWGHPRSMALGYLSFAATLAVFIFAR